MKSLVTGGCGFIGSHIVDELISIGHEVVVIDNESAESNEKFYKNKKAEYHQYNITDHALIEPLFKGVDYVFHLAAESRIQPTLERPQDACMTNFYGTCNVLQASRKHKIKRVIYSSTSSAYGLNEASPLTEDLPRDCLNPYSVSKVAAEDLCKMYFTLWNVPTITLRYFNVYGERQPVKGQYAPVIGIFLRQKKDKEALTIVGDGEQRRDFTHVSDVVQANINAMNTVYKNSFGKVFNIGTGQNHSVLEVANIISSNQKFIPPRKGEARNTLADISQANSFLNYKPTISLEDWVQSQL